MTSTVRLCVLTALGLTALPAFACTQPELPNMPAAEEVSDRAKRRIDDDYVNYTFSMVQYVDCLQAEHSAAEQGGAPDFILSLLIKRNNLAVAEVEFAHEQYANRFGPIEPLLEEAARSAAEIQNQAGAEPAADQD